MNERNGEAKRLALLEAVNLALHRAMAEDETVVVLGEDVGVNGGVFRATLGLRERFGFKRVLDTPLAENMIAGLSIGMAAQGLKPVMEIQFMGFIYAAMEQLVSHASRLRNRTRGRLACPLVLRTPMGAGIRAPEHHSEATEAMFAHIPGVRVLVPSSPARAYGLLLAAIDDPDPVIFLEPTRLYRMNPQPLADDARRLPLDSCFTLHEGGDLTLVSWGASVHETQQAAERLAQRGIEAEVIDVACLKPLDLDTLEASVRKTGRCVIVHEAPKGNRREPLRARPVRSAGADPAGRRGRYPAAAVPPGTAVHARRGGHPGGLRHRARLRLSRGETTMKHFKLPDLGEGLQEAEIVEWHVKAGDSVRADQRLVSVETAKALVDIPAPYDGVVGKLFGAEGDILHVGEPLVGFEGEEADAGTVVGRLEGGGSALEDRFFIGAAPSTREHLAPRATPAVRQFARQQGVELAGLSGSGPDGLITRADVEAAAQGARERFGGERLRGVRRSMALNMARSHAEVVPVTIYGDADLHRWKTARDPLIRLAQALAEACRAEPTLNAWFDGASLSLKLHERLDLGIAVDTPDGLFVPVLRDVGARSAEDLRAGMRRLREDVQARSIPPAEMLGATLTLSNFGTLFGRYANPVVVPPQVAILGAGGIRDEVVAWRGEMAIHPILPLSLSFDHRAATGGEAARFLKVLVNALEQPDG